jgi:hypothetical protein
MQSYKKAFAFVVDAKRVEGDVESLRYMFKLMGDVVVLEGAVVTRVAA